MKLGEKLGDYGDPSPQKPKAVRLTKSGADQGVVAATALRGSVAHETDPSVDLPAKLEGITFGQDVVLNGATKHTLYLSSDNDFLASFVLDDHLQAHVFDNPSKVFVFDFDQSDLDSLGTAAAAASARRRLPAASGRPKPWPPPASAARIHP